MVHNSKARIATLTGLILKEITAHRGAFDISDVKFDGTVFIKFKSDPHALATELAERFHAILAAKTTRYTRTTDVQFRVHLEEFEP